MSLEQGPITVVLGSDSSLMGDGLASLLADVGDVEVVGQARDFAELDGLVADLSPQAVIISARSRVVTSEATIAVAHRLRAMYPQMGVVIISDRADDFALTLLSGDSSGIALLLDERLASIATVLSALRGIQVGQTVLDPNIIDSLIRRGDTAGVGDLTRREVEVLQQLAHGLSNRAIADELHISVKSIEKGITSIFLKLGPFDPTLEDRRVSAALIFLRSQSDPFGPVDSGAPDVPVVVLKSLDVIVGGEE